MEKRRAVTGCELLASKGLTDSDILSRLMIPDPTQTTVFLSGSLVTGYGNTWSDLDVFCIGPRCSFTSSIGQQVGSAVVDNIIVSDTRIDFETLELERVQQLSQVLCSLDWTTNVCGQLSRTDVDLMFRLTVGLSIRNSELLNSLKDSIPNELLCRYLYRASRHELDSLFEDIAGALIEKDFGTSLISAQRMLDVTLDMANHSMGNTNPSAKWRFRIADSVHTSSDIVDQYKTLRFQRIDLSDAPGMTTYLKNCLAFSEAMVRRCQH